MKILEPVPQEVIAMTNHRGEWQEVMKQLPSIPDGMALPVQFENAKEAKALQYAIFAKQNGKNYTGQKYALRRFGATLYISKATPEALAARE